MEPSLFQSHKFEKVNVLEHIHSKGFTGIIGMEHGNSVEGKKGEMAVIEAYAKSDDF